MGDQLVRAQVCPPALLQFLRDEDDVLLNFSKGYLRVKQPDFLRALGVILGDLLHASLDQERSGESRVP